MRYPASEKLEIIRLVEHSHLPVRRTLDKLGVPPRTFYRWYDRYRAFGEAGLEDRRKTSPFYVMAKGDGNGIVVASVTHQGQRSDLGRHLVASTKWDGR